MIKNTDCKPGTVWSLTRVGVSTANPHSNPARQVISPVFQKRGLRVRHRQISYGREKQIALLRVPQGLGWSYTSQPLALESLS